MTRFIALACVFGVIQVGAQQADRDQAVRTAISALSSSLKVAPDKVQLVSAEPVDWPNSSLGCPKPGMSYMQVIVPGFRVRLAVGDRQHEVHTGRGQAIVCDAAADPAAPPRSPAVKPGIAAADRAKQHLATTLGVKADDVSIGPIRTWRATDPPCAPPAGTTADGETFAVELKRGTTTFRYRATPDAAWACK